MGYIYLIEAVGDYDTKYKIGFSKNDETLKRRLKAIQTGNPNKCSICEKFNSEHGRKVETSLHNLYSNKRKEGEWFELELSDVTNFMNTCEDIEETYNILKRYDNPYY